MTCESASLLRVASLKCGSYRSEAAAIPLDPKQTTRTQPHQKAASSLPLYSCAAAPGAFTPGCWTPKPHPSLGDRLEKKMLSWKAGCSFFAQSSRLKPPLCQALSSFRSLALGSYLLAVGSWNIPSFPPHSALLSCKTTSGVNHVQVLKFCPLFFFPSKCSCLKIIFFHYIISRVLYKGALSFPLRVLHHLWYRLKNRICQNREFCSRLLIDLLLIIK